MSDVVCWSCGAENRLGQATAVRCHACGRVQERRPAVEQLETTGQDDRTPDARPVDPADA